MGKSVYREMAKVCVSPFLSSANIIVVSFSLFPLLIQRQLCVCSLAIIDLEGTHMLLWVREKGQRFPQATHLGLAKC